MITASRHLCPAPADECPRRPLSNAAHLAANAHSDPSPVAQNHPNCFSAKWTIAQCLSVDSGLAKSFL